MKKSALIFILSIIACNIFAADPIIVKLNPQKEIVISGRQYYIINVVDNRADNSEKIGKSAKRDIILEQFPHKAFLEFYNKAFPRNNQAKTEVTLIINAIECEITSSFVSNKVKVNMEVEFVSPAFKSASYKVNVSNGVERIAPDAKTYAGLIERDLIDCMKELCNQNK